MALAQYKQRLKKGYRPIQKVLLTIVCLVLGIILAGSMLPDVVTDTVTDPYSENFDVDTGAGETSTTETLSYQHYHEDLTDLDAESTNGNDTPLILSYNEDTYGVEVGGLEASASRVLTIDYLREGYQQYTGFSTFIRLLPFLVILGLVVAAIWGLFQWHKGRGD